MGICAARGEIDMATAPAFLVELRACIDRGGVGPVSVDCTAVTFMDSAGYHVLVGATDYAAQLGRTLVIHNLPRPCARMIRLCDQEGRLHVEPPATGRSRPVSVVGVLDDLGPPAWLDS